MSDPAGESGDRPESDSASASAGHALLGSTAPQQPWTPPRGPISSLLGAIERRLGALESGLARRRFGPDLAAVAAIVGIALAFFAPVVFGPFHLPAGGGDLASFLFPMYRFIAQSLAAGDLPLWNPHQYAGAPLAADNQSGLLYPPHLLLFAVWPRFPYAAIEWSVALHIAWAGLGMYALLRSWRPTPRADRAPRPARIDAANVARPTAVAELARPAAVAALARPAAVLGAVAWMLSDGFVTHIGNLNYNAAAAWLPWALLGLHRSLAPAPTLAPTSAVALASAPTPAVAPAPASAPAAPSRRRRIAGLDPRWAVAGGFALGCGTLAGHAQVTFFTLVVLGVYSLWRCALERSLRPLFALGVVGLAGGGLAAPMLLPALALRPHTVRAAYDYATSLEFSLPADVWRVWLPSLLAPGLFGRGPSKFWGDWDRVEVGYIGLLPWLLAAVALSPARRSKPAPTSIPTPTSPGTRFCAVLAVVAFLIALGPATPIHRLVLGPLELPFRAPARFVIVADFAIAVLAAYGLDRLLDERSLARRALPAVAGATIAIAALGAFGLSTALSVPALELAAGCPGCSADQAAIHAAVWTERAAGMRRAGLTFALLASTAALLVCLRLIGRLPARAFALAAVLLLALDLIVTGAGTEIQRDNPATGYRHERAAAWLAAVTRPDPPAHSERPTGTESPTRPDPPTRSDTPTRSDRADFARLDTASGPWQPSAAQVHGLYEIGGVYNPLRLGLYSYVVDGLERRGSAVYNLLGARYLITAKGAAPSDVDFIRPVFTDDPAVDIWENERALPRVLLPTEVLITPDDAAAFETLREPDFDPTTTLVLTAREAFRLGVVEGPTAVAGDSMPGATAVPAGTAAIIDHRPDTLVIDVDLDRPAWVLLTDIHAPGWRATLDGRPVDVARADFAFRAVLAPAGAHRITMRYSPPGWWAGVASAMAVAVVCGWVWIAVSRPLTRPSPAR